MNTNGKIAITIILALIFAGAYGIIYLQNENQERLLAEEEAQEEEDRLAEEEEKIKFHQKFTADLAGKSIESFIRSSESTFKMTMLNISLDKIKEYVSNNEDSNHDYNKALIESGTYDDFYNEYLSRMEYTTNWIKKYLSDEMESWKNDDRLAGKLGISFTIGHSYFDSFSSGNLTLLPAVRVGTQSHESVYIHGGEFFVSGGSAIITSSEGKIISVKEGWNNLDEISGFSSGIYKLQPDRQYAGYIFHWGPATIEAGLIMKAGNQHRLAIYDSSNGSVNSEIDGTLYNIQKRLKLSFKTEEGIVKTVDLFPLMKNYRIMLKEMENKTDWLYDNAHRIWLDVHGSNI